MVWWRVRFAYHCWIESADGLGEPDVVDLTFRHNHTYAERNGFVWRKQAPPDYLWGPRSKLVLPAALDALPAAFPDGMLWLQETAQGWQWMTRQLAEHQNAFVALTAEALRLLQASLPPDSRLLAQQAPARPAVTTGSAPASVPVPAC